MIQPSTTTRISMIVVGLACGAAGAIGGMLGTWDTAIEAARAEALADAAPSRVVRAAALAGDYLVQHVGPDGRFDYLYDPTDDEVARSYNMLRHAGTTYALLEVYEAERDPRYLLAARRALRFLDEAIEACEPGLCVLDDGDAKLGGNGLAILAFAKHQEVSGDDTYLTRAQGLAAWIVSTQTDAGEFPVHKFDHASGDIDDFVSDYYPGEAIFGLVRLHALDGDARWQAAASKAAHWLIDVRDAGKEIGDLEHDHWLLYGLNELYAIDPDGSYVGHAFRIVDAIVAMQRTGPADGPEAWIGSFYTPPRSTPTATRAEGLLAAHRLARRLGDEARAQQTLQAAGLAISFQLQTQVTPARAEAFAWPGRALGGFTASLEDPTIRIDYVQHNLSALLAFEAVGGRFVGE